MNREGKKPNLILCCAASALGVWALALVLALMNASAPPWALKAVLAGVFLAAAAGAALLNRARLRAAYLCRRAALRRGTALLCTCALALSLGTAVPARAVEGSLTVAGIGLSDVLNEGTRPSDGSGGRGSTASWNASGTTIAGSVTPGYTSATSGGGCGGSTTTYYYYSSAATTLTLTNNSGEEAILSFDYTLPGNGGALSIDGASRASAGSFSKTLPAGGTVSVVLATTASPNSTSSESAGSYTASTTLSGVSLTPVNADVSVTLSAVTVGGSYTAKAGSTTLTVGQTYEYPAATSYTFTAAADVNYVFDGWYVNGVKTADSATYTRTFSANATVEARFVKDPLFAVTTVGGDGGVPEAYLEFDSDYYHLATGTSTCRHTNVGDLNTNNSYGAYTYFPYLEWTAAGSAIQSSWSGSVTGDNQTTMGYSNARAWLYSDVIRVQALQACTVSFDLSVRAGATDDHADYPSVGVYAYTYVTASASASTSTITSNGTLVAGGAGSGGFGRVVRSDVECAGIFIAEPCQQTH